LSDIDHIGTRHVPYTQIWNLARLMRPKQWVKNGFVLAPLIFTGEFLNKSAIADAVLAMVFFCLASSAAYIINDIKDIEQDRLHPTKCKSRPLADGSVSISMALIVLAVLYLILAFSWFLTPRSLPVIAAYILLNLAYSFVLKHQPVLDIFTIALCFVLRVYAGAMALSVPVSGWMFVTTLCLALYLAAMKRRQEMVQSGTDGRAVLGKYSVSLIERYAEMSATGALVFYAMFVMSVKPQMLITVPLVLFGLFRYWYIADELGAGESPTDALFIDWQLLLTVVLWVMACGWAIWPA